MAEGSEGGSALPADKILVLVCIYLATLSLSLLGSGSILAVALSRRPCCRDQLRPLALLSLADFLGAALLISTMAAHLLAPQRSGAAHGFCPYGRMFGMMFYAVSLLMVLVYACEVNQAVGGWRATPENRPCCPRSRLALPYALAWLLPCLVALALLALLQPSPQVGQDNAAKASNGSCSSCLILVHLSQSTCSQAQRWHLGQETSISFLVFVALVASSCVALYCRVQRWRCREHHGLGSEAPACSRVARSFQLVLLLCWLPACLLVVLSLAGLQPSTLFPLLVATGFLHSLVYGWLRGNFRREVAGKRLPLSCSPDLKAFYDDSLAASD